ncbi:MULTISPECIES: calcium-binding protein [Pseudomonas]|uniref:calcium-binding protein n=1 Tax=Pseudomonas TaxID=286 RepID=UPI001EF03F7A|nr:MULTISPECIES: calcium-binding protein [Pseudomonas]
MLSPYAHAPATARHLVPSVEPVKPKPSPYDPPADLSPGARDVRTHILLQKGDVTFSREITWSTAYPGKPKIVANQLKVETGNDDDIIRVRSWPGDKLQFIVNGQSYVVDLPPQQSLNNNLLIKTNGGNDTVIVEDDVKHYVLIEGGDGDDRLQAGAGPTGLLGQDGNDTLRLGSGFGVAQGGDGNDRLYGGSGPTILFGEAGDDHLQAGFSSAHKWNLLNGGPGDDTLLGGSGDNYLHGEGGDDELVGHDRTSFFTGEGNDRIRNNRSKDRIFAGANDHFDTTQGSAFTEVKPSTTGQ